MGMANPIWLCLRIHQVFPYTLPTRYFRSYHHGHTFSVVTRRVMMLSLLILSPRRCFAMHKFRLVICLPQEDDLRFLVDYARFFEALDKFLTQSGSGEISNWSVCKSCVGIVLKVAEAGVVQHQIVPLLARYDLDERSSLVTLSSPRYDVAYASA